MLLAHHELRESIHRVEVFRHQRAVLDLQLEVVFEEHDDLEHAAGVDRPGLEKRFAVVEHGRGVSQQQVVQHELADFRAQLVFVLHAESPEPDGWKLSTNRCCNSCSEAIVASDISPRSLGAVPSAAPLASSFSTADAWAKPLRCRASRPSSRCTRVPSPAEKLDEIGARYGCLGRDAMASGRMSAKARLRLNLSSRPSRL